MYFIFKACNLSGWIWCAVVAAYLIYRLDRDKAGSPRGFDVITRKDDDR